MMFCLVRAFWNVVMDDGRVGFLRSSVLVFFQIFCLWCELLVLGV